MKHTWTRWTGNPPPHDLDVVGWWGETPEDDKGHETRGKSCKRGGCCFVAWFGEILIPPKWWRASDPTGGAQ